MHASALPWWGWLIAAVVCYFVQVVMSTWTDNGSIRAWIIRAAFIHGNFLL